jgi:hypothetical protein
MATTNNRKHRTQTCTLCDKPSIPGLVRGKGKCQYHWNAGVWGEKWANEVERNAGRVTADARTSDETRAPIAAL